MWSPRTPWCPDFPDFGVLWACKYPKSRYNGNALENIGAAAAAPFPEPVDALLFCVWAERSF